MNDYVYRTIAEEQKQKLEFANRDAWKYENIYKYRPLFSLKSIFKRKEVEKPVCVTCCNC